jgi:hypothetical protein
MALADLPPLISGPYRMPECQIGDELAGEVVHGITDAPIQWPFTRSRNGTRRVILAGELVDAVQIESVGAIAAHWGVGRSTASGWRERLGVGRMTLGTIDAYSRL